MTTARGKLAGVEGVADGATDGLSAAEPDGVAVVVDVALDDAIGDGVTSPHAASSTAARRRLTAREIALGFTSLS